MMSDVFVTNVMFDWAVVFVFHVSSPFKVTRG